MNLLLVVFLAIVPGSVIGFRHTGKVVTVDSFMWNLQEPSKIKIDAKSPITIDFVAQIAPQSDSIKGKNLWRLGIFGSEHNDGHGERVGFKSQILKAKQASKRPAKGQPLKMKNIFSRFDLSQIGCNEVRYFCAEFAKNSDSTVDFELRSGEALDNIVSCKEMECRRPNADSTTLEGRETLPELLIPPPTARLDSLDMTLAIRGVCFDGSHNISMDAQVDPHHSTDTIRGRGLWRLGVFLSNASYGSMARSQYQPDLLNVTHKAKPLISGETLVFTDLHTALNTSGVGCREAYLQYLCIEFDRGENPIPSFELPEGPAILCSRVVCTWPGQSRELPEHSLDKALLTGYPKLLGQC
ncbi:hypothetical protein HOLleu_28954 [Holothuria leucospilota]|uniref:Uncharacterized protein n=1 Tax=Holothuria leucospilota TaxID=206669 RepID=A0A9Q1H1V3_HOLLE|nr:hypothetical protein HOLleu_28954 [Holothuria leucospilota]